MTNDNEQKKPDIVEMAKKLRHVKIVEKLHRREPPTQSEVKELAGYEGGPRTPGILDTQEQVAEVFGKKLRTIQRWVKDGMPVIRSGAHKGKYNAPDIQTWLSTRESAGKDGNGKSKNNWDSKYREYKARLAEIELKKAIGEVIPKKEVEAGLILVSTAIKRSLLTLPTTLAPRLQGLEPRAIEKIVREQVESIIGLFAKERIFAGAEIKDASDSRKAKNMDRKRK